MFQDSIQGKCEVSYETSKQPGAFSGQQHIYINKTIDFNRCQIQPNCHLWIPGISDSGGKSYQMKQPLDVSHKLYR